MADCGSTWSNGFTTSQTYDLAGNVKTITYPSGRVVNYSYNTAGQLSSFTGKLGGLTGGGPGGDVNYATAMQYNPRGQMIRETFGTNTALYHRKHYNRRGQLFDIRLGTDSSSSWDVEDPQVWQYANGSWNRGALRLFYSPNLNDYSGPNPAQPLNNGNIHRMDHFVPNALSGETITSWVMGSDDYLYDELNRLTQVTETPTGGSGPGFTQKFIYDRWGNRKIDIAATSNVGGGVTRIDFKVLTATNRLVAPSDATGDDPGTDLMRYDKAGNLVYDNYSPAVGQRGSMTYDAENRMLTSVNNSHQYRYEADGKRTRRLVAGSVEMWLVYGVNGELVAEYDAVMPGGTLKKEYGYRGGQMLIVYDATLAGDNQLKWVVTDHLGSTRMLVNRSGSLSGIQRRDYLPFGEELASSIGHRNASGAGYVGGNNPRQKFDAYERDSETGLDFAEARYYSSVQGRFTSVDPLMASAKTGDPQTWNRFVFVLNNPLRYVDPDGLQGKSAWEQLTEDERKILAPKLVTVKDGQSITKTELDAAGKKFNGLFKGLSDEKIEAGVTGFKNFIDGAGGHSNSEVWQQINQVEKFWIGDNNSVGIAVQVNNTSDFLKVLEKNGYDVNAYYEAANKHGDHINSARMVVDRSYQTSLHFVQQEGYTTRWDAHWDKKSVAFRRPMVPGGPFGSRKEEMASAALDHIFGTPISAKQVRVQIRQRGMAPRNEP